MFKWIDLIIEKKRKENNKSNSSKTQTSTRNENTKSNKITVSFKTNDFKGGSVLENDHQDKNTKFTS